ncbi:hypothetical protein ACH4UM_39030 [Streptomyces sp. NPDC020801]|uniref:hypothetical protein n=1 Tax=unclassified Streptomyces TaxID=2593676 RepID=UPI0037AB47F7
MFSLLHESSNVIAHLPSNELAAAVPQPKSNAPESLTKKVDTVLGIAAWAGTAAGVAGVLITGAMMAISLKRGESSEHMGRLGMVLGGCVLVATAGPLVSFVFA